MYGFCEALFHDLKFSLRMYRKSPGFLLTALLAISLGVGATAAVFSVTDRILFRPLPYRNGEQLVSFGMVANVVDDGEFLFAADYRNLFELNTPFQSVTSWSGIDDCDIAAPDPERQRCAEVDWSFLSVLGVHPILGDGFSRADVQPGAPRTLLLSYGIWRSHFGADRNIVGRTLMLDGAPARIIGVLPAGFELPTLQHADLLTPQVILPAAWQPGATRVLRVVGRLKDGMSLNTARAQLGPFFNHIVSEVPPFFRKEVQFRMRSVRDRQMGWARVEAWTLLGAVLAVMLISCANVANLLLARAAGRASELAIRNALGISRTRLLGQLLIESLLLAVTGGAIGCAIGMGLLRIAIAADSNAIPHLADARLDVRVTAMSLLLSLLAGVAFGLAPLFHTGQTAGLSGGSRTVTPRASSVVKNGLIAGQIAVSLVLVTAAGLLVRSLWNLEMQPLGMNTGHVLTAQLVLPVGRYRTPEERVAFFNEVERRLNAVPGIRALGLSDSLPPGGWERSRPLSALRVAGRAALPGGTGGLVNWRYVSPGYFDALRIPVLEGRAFQDSDRRRGVNLCILSSSLAHRLFAGQDPIGQQLRFGTDPSPVEIIGVAPDVKNSGLSVPGNPEYYILRTYLPDDIYVHDTGPVAQRTLSVILRSNIPDATLSAIIRRQAADLDSTLPVDIQSMSRRLGGLTAAPRFDTLLLVIFAGVGLLLAAIGLYGTVAYLVNQRTQEIGIRMSLGARPLEIAQLMLGYSMKWTAVGALVGVLGSIASTRLLASLLFRVSARDPITLIVATICLAMVALAATIQPARRAARVDPAIALRSN